MLDSELFYNTLLPDFHQKPVNEQSIRIVALKWYLQALPLVTEPGTCKKKLQL
jgi:hypothetical protein